MDLYICSILEHYRAVPLITQPLPAQTTKSKRRLHVSPCSQSGPPLKVYHPLNVHATDASAEKPSVTLRAVNRVGEARWYEQQIRRQCWVKGRNYALDLYGKTLKGQDVVARNREV